MRSKSQPGRYYAVHLEGVSAAKHLFLEPSSRPEPAMHGISRILHALDLRQFKKTW